MKYILGMIIALFLVLPLPAYSQQSRQGKANPPAKAKSGQPAPAVSQPAPAATQPAPVKTESPAAAKNEKPAFFTKINGDCLIRPKVGPEAGKWVRVAKPGQKIYSGDDILVRTGDVEIELFSETTVKLQAECMVTYFQGRENIRPLAFIRPDYPTTKIKVTKGTIFAKVSPYEISKHFVVFDTPSGVAGVRGTDFNLTVDADGRLSITTASGTVTVSDPGGNFTVDIPGGGKANMKKNDDGSFSIVSLEGAVVANSPNTTFKISPGGSLNLDQAPDGKTKATVPEGTTGSVNVQVGNVQANLNNGQSVTLGSQGNGTTIESTGTGTVFSTVDGKNVVSMGEGAKVLVTVDSTGTTIEGQSGNTTVTGPNGESKNLQSGESVKFDNTNQVNVEGEPCTPSVSPYKTCP